MARRYENMSEQEAREEIARRNHSRGDAPYPRDAMRGWSSPYGFGPGMMGVAPSMMGGGAYGWPFPSDYGAERGYGPGWGRQDGDRERDERDFMDRAGDEIASWFGDDDASARREADHRGRGPKGYIRSDARIEEDVNDRLTDAPQVDATEIAVNVKDREVTLDGTVDSRRAKRQAEDCADRVSGVTHVQNNLRVQQPAP